MVDFAVDKDIALWTDIMPIINQFALSKFVSHPAEETGAVVGTC
ncbi:MAG: hypothetical protein ACUVV0_14265 [Anaerolineae bacterium]